MTTTKFGFRQWSSQGDLCTEYWVTGSQDSGDNESNLKFTAGSLQSLYNGRNSNRQKGRAGSEVEAEAGAEADNDQDKDLDGDDHHDESAGGAFRQCLDRPYNHQHHPGFLPQDDHGHGHGHGAAAQPAPKSSGKKSIFSKRVRSRPRPAVDSHQASDASIISSSPDRPRPRPRSRRLSNSAEHSLPSTSSSNSMTADVSSHPHHHHHQHHPQHHPRPHSRGPDYSPHHLQPPSSAAMNGSATTQEKRKSGNFFLRHLHHRRKSSVLSPPDVTPPHLSPQHPPQSRLSSSASKHAPQSAAQPKSVLRSPVTNGNGMGHAHAPPSTDSSPQQRHAPETFSGHSIPGRRDEFEGVTYPDGLPGTISPTAQVNPSSRSAKGVKWAQNYGGEISGRPRRTSSAATHGRRSSIYSKAADGDYEAGLGVNAGVGSKARRLSLALPEELTVDECSLEEHFNPLARLKSKDIGEGGAAVVKLMSSKSAGTPKHKVFAIKEFRPRDPEEESQFEYERKIKSEYAISKSCQHPNIVETFRLCHSGSHWYHVMEYCQLGDLNDLITKGYFSREDRNCMFKQLVRGVDYLHSRGIAHRDLKSENLLVTDTGCLKIADFGTGEVFCGLHPGVRNCRRQSIIDPEEPCRKCAPGWVGSLPYMSPEIYQRTGEYDPRAADVWSCGIIYLTLCFGGNPWDFAGPECKNYSIYYSTWDDWIQRYPDGEVKKGRGLPGFAATRRFMMLDDQGTKVMVFGMLHPDPEKRWSIQEVLESKTVTEYPCCQQEGYSDDIRKRQKKVMHNHVPPKESKGKFLKGG
jgi:serine/threonine protein kinase